MRHEHQWLEDQWGKRCRVCGVIVTKKAEKARRLLASGLDSFLWMIQVAMAISALILIIKYPLSDRMVTRARDEMMYILGPNYWAFFYMTIAFACLIIRHMFPLKEAVHV